MPKFSACDAKYALAICDPFNPLADGACVPKLPARSSVKTSARLFGTISTNHETGHAYIAAKPNFTKDLDQLSVSTSSNTSSTSFQTDHHQVVNGKVVNYACSDLPWNYGYFVPAKEYEPAYAKGRIVSAGLRIRYIGKQEEMNGVVYAYSSPAHQSIEHMDINELRKQASCRRVPVSREWVTVTCSAIDDDEMDYSRDKNPFLQVLAGQTLDNENTVRSVCYPFGDGTRVGPQDGTEEDTNDLKGPPIMGLFILTQTTTQSSQAALFEYEYIVHTEIALRVENPLETPNEVGHNTMKIANALNVSKTVGGSNVTDADQKVGFLNELSKQPGMKGTAQAVSREVGGLALLGGRRVATQVMNRGATQVGNYLYNWYLQPWLAYQLNRFRNRFN